jgi:hypothetical protein
VLKRFIIAFVTFVALIVPSAFAAALLAAPARPAPLQQQPGCQRNLADASAGMAAMQARLASARGGEACNATRLYFLELVKARAVTAVCKSGPDRERALGRLDADVERINNAIAASCR